MNPIIIKTETDCSLKITKTLPDENGISELVLITEDAQQPESTEHIAIIPLEEIEVLINYLELIKSDLEKQKMIKEFYEIKKD